MQARESLAPREEQVLPIQTQASNRCPGAGPAAWQCERAAKGYFLLDAICVRVE